jgi:hypothetical protein
MILCAACKNALNPDLARQGHALHPGCNPVPASIDTLATELFATIAKGIDNQPRTLQTRIGPSEIGTPCHRRLGHKLAGTKPSNVGKVPWKAFIGTAAHEQISNIFAREEIARPGDIAQRWHVEERVAVGGYGPDGITVDGSTDLMDAWHGLVTDWKFTTRNKIREEYRPHGPGEQYRTQAHLYGYGWTRKGFAVATVAIVFFARDGEFTDRFVWSEPYDEQIALDAMGRLDATAHLLADLGVAALELLPTAPAYCGFCPFHKDGARDLTLACPGHPQTSAPDALSKLIEPQRSNA